MEDFKAILINIKNVLGAELFQLGGNQISILSIIIAILIFVASQRLARFVEKLVGKSLRRTSKSLEPSLIKTFEKFSGYTVIVIGFLMTFDTLGISLKSLAAISAVFMVGIGFGLQNIAQNFISGIIMLLERPVAEGDLVSVDGIEGRIMKIKGRATIVQTRDDVAIIVPNSKFISDNVVNDNHLGPNIRIKIDVGVAYGTNMDIARKMLVSVAEAHKDILSTPKPNALFTDFGDSSLDLRLLCWTDKQWIKDRIASDLRFDINRVFKENDISIPFPQREVRILDK